MATVINDLSISSKWAVNPGCPGVTVSTDTCPFFPGDPVYTNTLNDGVCATFDPHNSSGACSANERNDLQAGGTGRGVERCFESAFKLISYPTNLASASWHLIGFTGEVHGNGLPQAVIQPQLRVSTGVGTQGLGNTLNRNSSLPAGEPRLWIDSNAGQEPHRLYDCGPIPLNTWIYCRLHIKLTTDTTGFIKLYRDDDTSPRVNITGVVTTGGSGDYWKLPNYRNVGQSGATTYRWSGCRVWDGLCPNRAAGTTPPPTGTDTSAPTVTINAPSANTTYTGTIPYDVTVTDTSGLSNVWIGLGGNPIPSQNYVSPATTTFTGTLDVSTLAPGSYTFYAAAQDAAGNQTGTASPSFQVTVAAPTGGFQSLSGNAIGTGTLAGNLTAASVTAITSVAQRGEVEVTYKVPKYYEVLADGSFGAEVVWNGAQSRFEYAA